MDIPIDRLRKYIRKIMGIEAKLVSVEVIGGEVLKEGEIKGYGYGTPLLITIEKNGKRNKYVLNTIRPGEFGHEYMSDRAAILIWNHIAFNKLPKHVKSIDLGYFDKYGELHSINEPVEFFQLTEYVEGREYFNDLNRIGEEGEIDKLDIDRVNILAEYIAEIHSIKKKDPKLYRRKIRDLIGHGETIMGLIDSYKGDEDFLNTDELKDIETKCLEWRWKIRDMGHRLCRVHGDYHPWNIIFREGTDFTVLDRSRGEWGEAADDISAMTINYIFFSLIYYEKYRNPFKKLYETFMERYLELTGDEEIFNVIQPFYAWRGLVVANPIWYPKLKYNVRRALFNFIHNTLETDRFEYKHIDTYLGE
jgi:hypothetical protein